MKQITEKIVVALYATALLCLVAIMPPVGIMLNSLGIYEAIFPYCIIYAVCAITIAPFLVVLTQEE